MATPSDIVFRTLEERGFRLTGTRREVVAAIAETPRGFSADAISDRLPSVGRATVYRTIRLLQQLSVLCRVVLQDGASRYSLDAVGHHHHLVCVGCGSISDFGQGILDDLELRLEAALDGQLVGHRLEVYALCSACTAPAIGSGGPKGSPYPNSTHTEHLH